VRFRRRRARFEASGTCTFGALGETMARPGFVGGLLLCRPLRRRCRLLGLAGFLGSLQISLAPRFRLARKIGRALGFGRGTLRGFLGEAPFLRELAGGSLVGSLLRVSDALLLGGLQVGLALVLGLLASCSLVGSLLHVGDALLLGGLQFGLALVLGLLAGGSLVGRPLRFGDALLLGGLQVGLALQRLVGNAPILGGLLGRGIVGGRLRLGGDDLRRACLGGLAGSLRRLELGIALAWAARRSRGPSLCILARLRIRRARRHCAGNQVAASMPGSISHFTIAFW
jgi:hypothetical protein